MTVDILLASLSSLSSKQCMRHRLWFHWESVLRCLCVCKKTSVACLASPASFSSLKTMSWNPHRKCTSLPTKGFLLLIGVGLPQTRPTFGSCNFKSSLLKHSLFGSVSAETKMITLPLASEKDTVDC